MKIVFMGTPEFSVAALDALVDAGHEVLCVYSQPPRPAGRGKSEQPSPVHTRAAGLGLPVRTPLNFKDPADVADFAALGADLAVVVAYGLILPRAILQAPQQGCLNIHASLLPRWRGAAPIHRAIMAGDLSTGVCIMQMDEGLDTGPVVLRHTTQIADDETTLDLHDRLAEIGAAAIVDALATLVTLTPEAQDTVGVTYAHKIDKAEARIDWSRPAQEVARHIRGLSPFPGAWSMVEETRVKFLNARAVDQQGPAGQVISDLRIACGTGAIDVTRAQRAGKSAQETQEFLRGMPSLQAGTQFT